MTMFDAKIRDFQVESNKIEGIEGATDKEVRELGWFINLPSPRLADVSNYVKVCQSNAVVRDRIGLDVRVGNHTPPPGGPMVIEALVSMLKVSHLYNAFEYYCMYENLHPYTDGNGRSGRALWLWHHSRYASDRGALALKRGFLHSFHYESLDAQDARK